MRPSAPEESDSLYRAVFHLWGDAEVKAELRYLSADRLDHFFRHFKAFVEDTYRDLLAKRGLRGAELYVEEGAWISSSQALSFASREAVRDRAIGYACPLTEALESVVGRRLVDQGLLAKLKGQHIPRFGARARGPALFEQTDALAGPWASGQAGIDADGIESVRAKPCALTRAGKHMDVAKAYRVSSADFGLFSAEEEACLEGTLISEPHVSVNGNVMALVRDTSGEMARILLYGHLPPGADRGPQAQALAHAMFPRGTRLTVMEPLSALPRDGVRGMCVASPSEVRKFVGGADALGLADAKAAGNAAVAQGQYAAAAEFYRLGVGHADAEAVVTLLSNRAQAELKTEQFAGALADAAAALQMRPFDSKAWARYELALSGLGCAGLAARAQTIASGATSAPAQRDEEWALRTVTRSAVIAATKTPATVVGPGEEPLRPGPVAGDAVALKAAANEDYRLGKYGTARGGYTKALACEKKTSDAAAALGNLAHCHLVLGELHSAVAAAAACLRLCPTPKVAAKAAHRLALGLALLGETGLAAEVLAASPLPDGIGDVARQCVSLAEQVKALEAREESGYSAADLAFEEGPGALGEGAEAAAPVAEWLGPAEAQPFSSTVLASRDLDPGEIVMVQRPLKGLASGVHGRSRADAADACLRTNSEWLVERLAFASCTDLAAARTIELLGSERRPDLMSRKPPPVGDAFAALLQRLNPRLMPLLGQRADFAPVIERLPAPPQLIEALVSEFQAGPTEDWRGLLADAGGDAPSACGGAAAARRDRSERASGLYPAIAMLGRVSSHLANCAIAPVAPRAAGALAVFTTRAVPSGGELLLAQPG